MSTLADDLRPHLEEDFRSVNLERLGSLGTHYKGKVRDLFFSDDDITMITSDRLSAFDVVLSSIPCKGAILNAITLEAFEATKDICPNHIVSSPHPNVLKVRRAEPIAAEIIVRRYITGSLWRDYQAGKAGVYGIEFPTDLKKDQRFDEVIITPSTKAPVGEHDEPISREGLVEGGYVEKALLDEACEKAVALFKRGEDMASERGLILVDTKYEFGMIDGKLHVIDEIHTADSSRYWIADGYQARFDAGDSQQMLDKENIRQWLIQQGYQGEGTPPVIPEDLRLELALKYAELHERLLGKAFDAKNLPKASALYDALNV